MNIELMRNGVKNFGLTNTFYDMTMRAINRLTLFKILKCMHVSKVDPSYLQIDQKYTHGFLDKDRLKKFATNSEYELSPKFLEQAMEKGDQCYAILEGDVLASYGWYSNKPTAIHPEELILDFKRQYIYMYKGYTHVNYRGQRLHAIGMVWALKRFLEEGCKGIVSYVEASNFSSLKSVYRMGYKDCGNIYIAKVFDKYLIHSDNGCKEYGFSMYKH